MNKSLRSHCVAAVLATCSAIGLAQSPPSGVISGTWQPLAHSLPANVGAGVPMLLTDGTVMVPSVLTNHWYKLTPDATGSYVNGTWSQLADMRSDYGPLYDASAVLADGRVVVVGGEYNNLTANDDWTKKGAIYNPTTNTWVNLDGPASWNHVGDAECTVLPDGRFMMADSIEYQAATLDPTTLAWTPISLAGRTSTYFDEEGWTLLPDGTVFTSDVWDTPNASKYVISDNDWVSAGVAPNAMTSSAQGYEMGPAVLRFNGTVVQFGANGYNALYTPPGTPTDPGTWAAIPSFPTNMGADDAPACLLPDGNVLCAADHWAPNPFTPPTQFYEYDGGGLAPVNNPVGASVNPSYVYTLLVLPNGQVLLDDFSNTPQVYTPANGPLNAWRPTISNAPAEVSGGSDYFIQGTQFNGLSQTNAYGDDNSNASNYPLVRITNNTTGHVFYCRTHDHSTMAVATNGTTVSTHFVVPAGIDSGDSVIEVVANGIPSISKAIFVGSPSITSLAPNTATAGDPDTVVTINGDGFVSGAVVQWTDASNNETDLTPSSITGSQITVTVPASLLTTAQTCSVDVDNSASFISNSLNFTINPANHPPVANAGPDQTIEATGPTTSFTLDGTGSTDADNDPLTYTWYDSSNVQVGTGSTLTLSRAVGVYTFKLTVSDGKASNDDTVQITIQDTAPPSFSTLPDITVAAASNAGTLVNFGPFYATDIVDGSILGTAVPPSGTTFPAGSTLVTVSATDAHSNTGQTTFHVNVLYSWSGFLSPFPKQQYKMGSNIPVKFALTGASAGITNLVATGYWNNGGSNHLIGTFVYSPATGQYQLQFKTNGVPKGLVTIIVVFGDGSVHTIQVVLK